MRKLVSPLVAGVALVLGFAAGRRSSDAHAQQQSPTNYLQIEECRLPAGVVIGDAIAMASRIAAEYRKTGQYKSVKLFVHHYGPALALYTVMEPRSWAAVEAGFAQALAANPEFLTTPFLCAEHSDNILVEVAAP